ncbi:MAG TPA: class I SAM-dependent methyltransferase [Gaiellaceae bacterium]
MASPPEHVEANRAAWNARADEYQRKHGQFLRGDAWGTWQIREAELGLLGDVAGKDVLELGCGAARFSIVLAARGAYCVGLDYSERQIEHARSLGADFPLIHAAAEDVPLPDASFDVIFSDHGALSWGDPSRVVPEVGRLLRPRGLLVFNVTSPFARMCLDEEAGHQIDELLRPYFGLRRIDEGDGAATYNLGYGEWIRLLLANGLAVEGLVEPQPPEGATTTYGIPVEWAKRWPAECIWVARKQA